MIMIHTKNIYLTLLLAPDKTASIFTQIFWRTEIIVKQEFFSVKHVSLDFFVNQINQTGFVENSKESFFFIYFISL